jgi:ATP-binding cassette subfamily B protein
MFLLLEQDREIADEPGASPLEVRTAEVRFEHVDFAYDPRRQVLFDVDFTIAGGTTTAVVGATGSGKSTLARLLFRFYEVGTGRILIDGQDVRTVTQATAARSASCRRTRCSSTTRSNTTSPTAGRVPAARTSRLQRALRISTLSSSRCRTAMRRWSASAG